MIDKRYWLWLQTCLGAGVKFSDILDDFGSVEKLYESNLLEWKMSPALTPQQIEKLARYKLEDTQKIIDDCNENHWSIITYDDELYPSRLREIINPPAVLYVDGELDSFDSLASIAIVGTRKASTYALKSAHIMAKGFALCGGAVISGGALGVDSAAHSGALEAGGKTYAVLGCGLGTKYLEENAPLRKSIINGGGALITEGAGIPKDSLDSRIIFRTDTDQRLCLINELRNMKHISPKANNNWRFVPEDIVAPAIERDRKILFGK